LLIRKRGYCRIRIAPCTPPRSVIAMDKGAGPRPGESLRSRISRGESPGFQRSSTGGPYTRTRGGSESHPAHGNSPLVQPMTMRQAVRRPRSSSDAASASAATAPNATTSIGWPDSIVEPDPVFGTPVTDEPPLPVPSPALPPCPELPPVPPSAPPMPEPSPEASSEPVPSPPPSVPVPVSSPESPELSAPPPLPSPLPPPFSPSVQPLYWIPVMPCASSWPATDWSSALSGASARISP